MPKKRTLITAFIILIVVALAVFVTFPTLYDLGILNARTLKTAKDGQIRVACVGDSITYGCMVSNWSKNNYPAQLGEMLGGGYCVNNFGYSGRSATFSADHPYVGEILYRQSIEFNPNIVVIMLGSNDTRKKNWRGVDGFVEDYTAIINSYLRLESVEEVYIMSPPPSFKNPYNINSELLETVIRDTVENIAVGLELKFIDIYGLFENKAKLFSDGAHPNAEGARIIAQTVYRAIKNGGADL